MAAAPPGGSAQAAEGRRRIGWIEANMPLLAEIRLAFAASRPLDGLTIGVSLHLEPKTAVLLETLVAGGATVVATGNLGTTQDDVALALAERGLRVYGRRDDDRPRHLGHVRAVLGHRPQLLLDNGADLVALSVEELGVDGILGGTEETTSGGRRLREDLRDRVPFPVVVINDSPLKLIVENEHAVGQSAVESFMRITNLMVPGRRFVVFGYGPCGRGIARSFASWGGHVAVVEPDEIRALEAAMAGYAVVQPERAVAWGEVFVTATGAAGVIGARELAALPDGAVLANAGHFDWEVDVPALRAAAADHEEPDEGIERFTLPDGRRLVLLTGGRMFTLAGRAAKGNSIESMDLGFALQALSLVAVAEGHATMQPGAQPVPDAIDRDLAARVVRRLAPPWALTAGR